MDSIKASLVARPNLLQKFSSLSRDEPRKSGKTSYRGNSITRYLDTCSFVEIVTDPIPRDAAFFPGALGELRLRDRLATYYCKMGTDLSRDSLSLISSDILCSN